MALVPISTHAQVVIALDDQLGEFWIVKKKVAPRYPQRALDRMVSGCAAVGYIIKDDGSTSDHKVLAYNPSQVFNRSAISAARNFKYQPAEQNPEKTPAITLNVFTYQISADRKGDGEKGKENREVLYETCLKAGKKALATGSAKSKGGQ